MHQPCSAWASYSSPLLPAGQAADPPKKITAESINELKTTFKDERAASVKAGYTKMFSPEWFERADALAKEADDALADGRLLEANEALRRARWSLPYPPANMPEHLARIFGDGRLRHTSSVQSIAFSPDGAKLVSGSQDGTVKVWDMGTGRELVHYSGHQEGVRAVAYSPDGKWIASAGQDKEIKIWDSATGKDVKALQGHTELITSIAFSPDGKLFVAGGLDRHVRFYELETGKIKWDFGSNHTLMVTSVCFSADGKMAASGSIDRRVCIWDMTNGQIKGTFTPVNADRGTINAVAFNPDGKTLAVAARAGQCAADRPTNGGQRQVFEGHSSPITCIAFSKDGKTMASGSSDRSIRLWDVRPGRAIGSCKATARKCAPSPSVPTARDWPPPAPITRFTSGSWATRRTANTPAMMVPSGPPHSAPTPRNRDCRRGQNGAHLRSGPWS